MREFVLKIDKMTYGGGGLGRTEGKVCFVPFTAPGDVAQVRVLTEKRSYIEGTLIALAEQSRRRVAPPCPVFGICGGCNWQHLSYDLQLAEKENIFAEILWRSARVAPSRILPIIGAAEPYGYRARVQFKVRWVNGAPQIGFYRSGSHYVVSVPGTCAIVRPKINSLIPEMTEFLRLFPEPDKIPQIDVAVGEDDEAAAVWHYIGSHRERVTEFFAQHRSHLGGIDGLYLQSGRKASLQNIGGESPMTYRLPMAGGNEQVLSFSPGSFSQINYRQNRELVAAVFEGLAMSGTERVLDIYCGNGNFSLPLSTASRSVTGIEEFAPSVTDANRNAQVNLRDNILFRCIDAVEGVQKMVARRDRFDVILLDPPRSGAADVVRLIPDLKPGKIAYVSCDPSTLARDIGILRGRGYDVVSSRPVDMFPQTHHIESVTVLEPVVSNNPV